MSLPKTFTAGERLFASDLNDNFNNLDGRVDTVETSGFRFAGTRYYTSDGTFDKSDPLGTGDIGLRAIRVEVMGAGGGGGGSDVNSLPASAGGGGGYARSFITDIAGLSSSETVTVGAGGTGGIASPAGNGGTGGTSSFGTAVTGTGGGSGLRANFGSNMSGGSGGTGTGDLVISGGHGDFRPLALGGNNSLRTATSSSFLSGSLSRRIRTDGGSQGGLTGELYGGGGGGACKGSAQSAVAGGPGSAGIVIVECYV